MAIKMSEILTPIEAAKILGLAQSGVCRYCQSGRLKATKVGRQWLIDRKDLDAFAKKARPRGNPNFKRRRVR